MSEVLAKEEIREINQRFMGGGPNKPDCDRLMKSHEALRAENAELRKRLAEAEKDAAKQRYLSRPAWGAKVLESGGIGFYHADDCDDDSDENWMDRMEPSGVGDTLESAIDDAMKRTKESDHAR